MKIAFLTITALFFSCNAERSKESHPSEEVMTTELAPAKFNEGIKNRVEAIPTEKKGKTKAKINIADDEIFDANKIPAIFIYPDSSEVDSLAAQMGEDFYSSADDYNFYDSKAMEFLRSRGVKYTSTDRRFVRFIINQVDTILIDTDSLSYVWGLILFDGDRPPIISSAIDIESNF